jgi:glycine/D-amino acid oxidase-like deaminating enzyme
MKPSTSCLDLGNDWAALWVQKCLRDLGVLAQARWLKTPNETGVLTAYVGNGETRGRTERTFGVGLTSTMWGLSERSHERVLNFLNIKKIPATHKGAAWLEKSEAHSSIMEFSAGSVWNREDFVAALLADGGEGSAIDSIVEIEQRAPFDYAVKVESGRRQETLRASAVFIATERLDRQLLPGLSSIWLPATMNRFVFSSTKDHPHSISLFHEGADFALRGPGSTVTLGSFRNLFEDRGYGIRPDWVDTFSQENVTRFFHGHGWIDGATAPRVETWVESISCDGLPIVGSLPANPGVFLLAGFAGRPGNWIFETAFRLAQAFVSATPDAALAPLSPKRFT